MLLKITQQKLLTIKRLISNFIIELIKCVITFFCVINIFIILENIYENVV